MTRLLTPGALAVCVLGAVLLDAAEIHVEGLADPLRAAVLNGHAQALSFDSRGENIAASNAWAELGMLLLAHNLYEQAIVAYGHALDRQRDPRWFYLRSIARGELGQSEGAIEDLVAAVGYEPEISVIWYRLGQALLSVGRLYEAEEALVQALVLDEHLTIAHMTFADVLRLLGRPQEAKAALMVAHEIEPNIGQITYRLAQVERELGNLEASKAWLQKSKNQRAPVVDDPLLALVAEYSLNPAFFISASRRAWERGDEATAVAAYRHALELTPGSVDNALGFVHLLISFERIEEASQVLRDIEAPMSSKYWHLAAQILVKKGKLKEANQALKKSLRLHHEPSVAAFAQRLDKLLHREMEH